MKFEFYRDEKCTIWWRDWVEIEADSYDEAVNIITESIKNGDYIECGDSEPIYETYDVLDVKDNNNQSTIEIFDKDRNMIYKNGE